tara:strand:- start:296 stop:529 length:234 start_codon:yes stop_codon:yes gene_type:complete
MKYKYEKNKIKALRLRNQIKGLKEILKDLTTLHYKAEKLDYGCASIIITAEDVITKVIKYYERRYEALKLKLKDGEA